MSLLTNFVSLFVESAPWLLLGFVVAGVMKAFIPDGMLARHLGKPGFSSTLKAALLGAPLPLCSCGVIPAAVGLRRGGASRAATTSFLISTPETGVDSISISYALLGPFMAVIRPIAAVTSALTAGLLAGSDDKKPTASVSVGQTSCCASQKAEVEEKSCCASKKVEVKEDSCCASKKTEVKQEACCSSAKASEGTTQTAQLERSGAFAGGGFSQRVKEGLQFTFVNLVKDISLWLLIGLGFAALVKTYVPVEFLAQWGDGLLAFVVMALIGVPMYICATASTPIAAGLLFSGVSPGAVLVFMLVGPATNVATVGLVKRELGNRALAAYLGSVVGVGFAFGYLTNFLASHWHMDFIAQSQHAHDMLSTPLSYAAGFLLAALMLNVLLTRMFHQ